MFKLFKTQPTFNRVTNRFELALKEIVATVVTKGRTTNEIIEEIHETFYTEVDKLLAEAKVANSLETDKQEAIDKCNRLKALGFTNSKEVIEAQKEIDRLNALEAENRAKESLIKAIDYFSFKYPQYKFITEHSVKGICAKYGLIYGKINRYIGTVPDKNLKHMEDFKINHEDNCFEEYFNTPYIDFGSRRTGQRFMNGAEYSELDTRQKMSQYTCYEHHKLEIAAPKSDFDLEGYGVKDHKISKIEIPDPVVLHPVCYNNQKYYLIVTAWGLEASDPLIVNERNN